MTDLTKQDLEMLIEAVEAWESKDAAAQLMDSMLGSLVCKNDEDRKRFEEKQEQKAMARNEHKKMRKERSIILRAKLIAMRDSANADKLLAEVCAPEPDGS